jgi:Holliday junction resolvasome RuvABC endonuclease subunit
MTRLFAVDPGLLCSGWALFKTQEGSDPFLLAVGKISPLGSKHPMAHRLEDLQVKFREIREEARLGSNDILVCEAPTTMRDPRAALVVEQVRGVFETVAREAGMRVPGRVHPRSVQYEVMGLSGKQLPREVVKSTAIEVAVRLHGERLKNLGLSIHSTPKKYQDIIDAVLIGTYGLSAIAQAEQVGEPWEKFFSQNEPRRNSRFRLTESGGIR